jgi:hypothetical protein
VSAKFAAFPFRFVLFVSPFLAVLFPSFAFHFALHRFAAIRCAVSATVQIEKGTQDLRKDCASSGSPRPQNQVKRHAGFCGSFKGEDPAYY